MKRLAAIVFLFPVLAVAQDKVELNKITRVEVKPGSIAITGSRTPNFNTFTMSDPPRLVIDLSEAVFSGVPEVIRGEGAVTGVKTASYGSASAAIARVLIGFDREVETDIQTSGTSLTIRIVGGAAPVAQGELGGPAGSTRIGDTTDPEAQQRAVADAQQRAQDDRAQQEQAAREAAARAEEERKAQAGAQQQAQEEARAAREREEAEARQRAEAERQTQTEAQRKAEAEAAQRAEADRKAREEAQRKADEDRLRREQREAEERAKRAAEEQRKADEAAAREAAKQAAEEKQRVAEQEREARRKAEEERKAAEKAAREAEAAAKKAAEEERRRQLEEEREAKRRAEEERKAQQEQEARARAAAEEERRARAKADREERERLEAEKKKAAAEERARRDEERRQAEEAQRLAAVERRGAQRGGPVAGGRRTVSLVGFRPDGRGSRVFIRTDGPASYELREADDTTVVVVLANTRIGSANNARFLDTSFFGTPVQLVNPTEVGDDVHVEIKLKTAVPYQARQDGGELVLVFSGR